MKIGVLMPTRGDRPQFLQNCLRQLSIQTLKPEIIIVVDDPPRSEVIDIGWRYKIGYERLQNRGLDLIAFWEDDDFYVPDYLEFMAAKWVELGKPLLLGTKYTIYYHLKLKKYFYFHHEIRSSAMNTIIRPNIDNIDWGPENDPYTDIHLWTKVGTDFRDRIVFKPEKIISIGMKGGHGATGKVGGFAHTTDFGRYDIDGSTFLEEIVKPVDPEGYEFYQEMHRQLLL